MEEEQFVYFQPTLIAILLMTTTTFLNALCLCCRWRRREAARANRDVEEHIRHNDSHSLSSEEGSDQSASCVSTVPLKPGRPRVLKATFDSIELEWTKPEQDAQSVIAYWIFYHSYSDPPDKWIEQRVKGAEEMVTVSQLSEKTSYSFKVQPEYEDGTGIESDISEPIATKMIMPSKPGTPIATNITYDEVQLEWTKPEQGAHNIIAYRIFYRFHNDLPNKWIEQKIDSTKEMTIVSCLLEGTIYSFKVQPEYEDGYGLESDISEPITTKMIVPSKPGKPIASNVTHDSIQLEWTKPEQGAHNVTSYTVCHRSTADPLHQWTKQDVALTVTVLDDCTHERVLVTQLVEKTAYYFKVRPEYAAGSGLESDISEPIKTKGMIPSQPGKPICSSVSHNSIQLEWTKPEQGAQNIIAYHILYHSHGDPSDKWIEQKVQGAKEMVTISQLSERTTYPFTVQPEYEDGVGLESDISEPVTTKMTIPSKSGMHIATNIIYDKIQLGWTKQEQGTHSTIESTKEKIIVSCLLEGTIYSFKVQPEYEDGYGLESDISKPITTKLIVPSKPGMPIASNITHDSIQVEWTKPKQGAHNITSYTVFYCSTNDPPNQWMQQKTESAEEKANVAQLSEKSTYLFKVRPESKSGKSGLESDESEPIRTKMIIPSKPGKPIAHKVTHDSVELEWTKSEQGAHNILSYTIFCRLTSSPLDKWSEQVTTTSEKATLSNLSEKTFYNFKVQLKYEGGDGCESDVSEPVQTLERLNISEIRDQMWDAREKWYNIGLKLGLKMTDLNVINKENRDIDSCFTKMLIMRLRMGGLTRKMLIDALNHKTVAFNDLAHKLEDCTIPEVVPHSLIKPISAGTLHSSEGFKCPICGNCTIDEYLQRKCPKFDSSSDSAFPYLETKHLTEDEKLKLHIKLTKETDNINQKFISLIRHVRKSLNRIQGIDLQEMADFIEDILSLSSPLMDSSEMNSAGTILKQLQRKKYVSFFNYHIVKDLIANYGTDEDKKELCAYEEKFKKFCERSVFEVPEAVFGPRPDHGQMLAFKVTDSVVNHLCPLATSDVSPPSHHTVETTSRTLKLSLNDALFTQEMVAKILGIENIGCLVFLGATKGCIELKFSVPNVILDRIKRQQNMDTLTELPVFVALAAKGIHILCGPPGKPYATEVSSDNISLQWKKPEYQGLHQIQHYLVHYKSLNDTSAKWRTVQSNAFVESLDIGRLSQNQAPLIFKVQAVDAIGPGVQSEKSDPIDLMRSPLQLASLKTSGGYPSKPGKPRALRITHDSIQLEWTKPERGSDSITSYIILYRSQFNDPPNHWMEKRTISAEERTVVSQLSENTTYFFQVQPEYGTGIGLESDVSDPILTELTVRAECDNRFGPESDTSKPIKSKMRVLSKPGSSLGTFSGQMKEERRFEEIPDKTSTEVVNKHDSQKEMYSLSEEEKLLLQESCTEDEKMTTAVPPNDDKDVFSTVTAVAGTTYYSNGSLLDTFSGQMREERRFEGIPDKISTEVVNKRDYQTGKYGLSEEGKLLSQESCNEDEKTTTAVPSSNDKDVSSTVTAVAGTTYYSNVTGASQIADLLKRLEDLEIDTLTTKTCTEELINMTMQLHKRFEAMATCNAQLKKENIMEGSSLGTFSGQMGEERRFEEIPNKTSTEVVNKRDYQTGKYGLSEEGKLLSQESCTEDEKTTTAVPPSNDKDVSSTVTAVAGTTYYSNVTGASQIADILKLIKDFETNQEEQKREIKEQGEEQKKEIKDLRAEQKWEIKELRTEHKQEGKDLQEERKREIKDLQGEYKTIVDTLTTEAEEFRLKVEELMKKTMQLHKRIEAMVMCNAQLKKENIMERNEHQAEKKKLEVEIDSLRKQLQQEHIRGDNLRQELKKELKNLERMNKVSHSLDKKDSRPELYRSHSLPNQRVSAIHTL